MRESIAIGLPDGLPTPVRRESPVRRALREMLVGLAHLWAARTGRLEVVAEGGFVGGRLPPEEFAAVAAALEQNLPTVWRATGEVVVAERPARPEVGGLVVRARYHPAEPVARPTDSGYESGQEKTVPPVPADPNSSPPPPDPAPMAAMVAGWLGGLPKAAAERIRGLVAWQRAFRQLARAECQAAVAAGELTPEAAEGLQELGFELSATPAGNTVSDRWQERVGATAAADVYRPLPDTVGGGSELVAAVRERVAGMPLDGYDNAKRVVAWLNQELGRRGVAVRCPTSHRPSVLVAVPGGRRPRFYTQNKDESGHQVRPFSTRDLPALLEELELAPAVGRRQGRWELRATAPPPLSPPPPGN